MSKEGLKEFYQKNRSLIFPVLVGLASLLLIFLVLIPQIGNLISDNSSLTQVQEKSRFLEVKASELQNVDEVKLQKDLNISLNALPSNKDYLEVINLIQALLPQSGFSLNSLQFGQDTNQSTRLAFTVKMELSGPRSSLNVLLTNFESTYRPMRIASIETNTKEQNSAFVSAVILLNIFYSPLPTSLGSVETPLPKLSDKDQELINNLAKVITPVSSAGPVSGNVPLGKSDPFQ